MGWEILKSVSVIPILDQLQHELNRNNTATPSWTSIYVYQFFKFLFTQLILSTTSLHSLNQVALMVVETLYTDTVFIAANIAWR